MLDLVASGASPTDIASSDAESSLATFLNGEAAFMRHWSTAWDYVSSQDSQVKESVGLTTLPSSCLGGQSLALSRHSLHPDRALHFIAFLAGYEQQIHMALQANQPPSLAAAYMDVALRGQSPLLEVLGVAVARAQGRPSVADYALVSEAVYSEVNRMLAGHQDAQTTADNIQQRIEAIQN